MRPIKASFVIAVVGILGLSGAALLGALLGVGPTLGLPKTDFGPSPNGTAFYASTRELAIQSTPISTNFGAGAVLVSTPKSIDIHILIPDASGTTVASVPGDDFVATGEIDQNGDFIPEYSGVLLTGEILAAGSFNGSSTTDAMDFRFRVTGGSLMPLYSGRDIGVTLVMEASTFNGTFSTNFTAGAKGAFAPIPCAGTIGDYVWHDLDRDGLQEPGEPGINGVIVTLSGTDNFGNPVSQTVTTSTGPGGQQGYYQFKPLCAGTYTISATTPAGFDPTASFAGGDTGVDSNGSPATVVLTGLSDQTIDFGFVTECTGVIGDFVWHDLNRNGLQDPGEPGIDGVDVALVNPADNSVIATTVTGPNGYYSFGGLCAGDYKVVVDESDLPPTFTPTDTTVGSNTAIDSNPNPSVINLPSDTTADLTIDFGYKAPCTGSLGDYVWYDKNQNGLQDAGEAGIAGVTLRLKDGSDALLTTTTTGAGGVYAFTGLCAGTYKVEVDASTVPAGFSPTLVEVGPDRTVDSNPSPFTVTLATDASTNTTIDYGYIAPCTGQIGDLVWKDLNANGLQDAGEPGLAGVTVHLKAPDNTVIQTGITDANGLYLFNGLCPGTYKVEVVPPVGALASPAGVGSNTAIDSNANPSIVTLLLDDSVDLTNDFGFYYPPASLGDFVWEDLDLDGQQDAGEPGIDGVVVELLECGNPVAMQTTVTAGGGAYLFSGLAQGCYQVRFGLPAGYTRTVQNVGGDATDSDADATTGLTGNYNLAWGEFNATVDSGLYRATPSIDIEKATNGQDADTPTGPVVAVGSTVTWTYVVTNTGNVPLTDVVVTDDKVGAICTIGPLAVGQSQTCTATGIAQAGQYANLGTTTGNHGGTTVSDTDPSHYFGAQPAIKLVKLTNGTDNNSPTGPVVPVGSTVTWSYQVTNTGNVTLTNVIVRDDNGTSGTTADDFTVCTIPTLAPGATQTCTKTGVAVAGQYKNWGTATGTYNSTTVSSTDPDHYFGAKPAIKLVKKTNGTDNNSPTGPVVPVGSTVTWTYQVTNTGNVPLTNVVVRDDNGTAGTTADDFTVCTIATLAPGATQTCTKTGIAVAGQYKNWGTATGTYNGTTVTSQDPDHYFGAKPAISLVKLTNGTNNNSPTGPIVFVGSTVTWTYRVTNTGNVTLTNVVVRDDNGTAGTTADDVTVCVIASLAAGATQTCTKTGIAVAGQYKNWGTVTGTYNGTTVTAQDPDHYYGEFQWGNETACGAGIQYPNTSNWFMYTPYTTAKVNLIAGQHYDAGDVYMTRTSTHTTIKIVLHADWRWASVPQNLKIQPYNNAPSNFVEPGDFDYKYTVSGNTVTVTIKGTSAKFYGIHGDVQRRLN